MRASLSTSLRCRTRSRRPASKLDNPHRPVVGHKRLIRNPPYIRLCDLVDPVDRAEYLPPVVIARLIQAERDRYTLIPSDRPHQLSLRPRLAPFHFSLLDVFFLPPLNL